MLQLSGIYIAITILLAFAFPSPISVFLDLVLTSGMSQAISTAMI